LKNLTTKDIQGMINSIHESGKLEVSSLKKVFSVLDDCLEYALHRGLISKNPCKFVELPKGERKERNTLKRQELPAFLNSIKESPYYAAFRLELFSGLRRGELLGLRWSDVDLEKGQITIKQQLTPTKKIKGLKTESSYRIIKIFGEIVDILKAHKKPQNKKKALLGKAYNREDDLVFCHDDGSRICPRAFLAHYKSMLKKSGLNTSLSFHDLRHSFATMGLEAGIPIKTLQSILGHKTPNTLLTIYAHVTESMQEDASIVINDLLAVNKQ
jgi:integrase